MAAISSDKSRHVGIAFAFPCNAHATTVVVNHNFATGGTLPDMLSRAFSGSAAVGAYDVKAACRTFSSTCFTVRGQLRRSRSRRCSGHVGHNSVQVPFVTASYVMVLLGALLSSSSVILVQDMATCRPGPVVARVVDGGVTATGMLSRQRGNLITIGNTQ